MTLRKNTRVAEISRTTKETDIQLKIGLDGLGQLDLHSPVSFFDHMLTVFAVHGGFDLSLTAKGDTDVDDHHTVEDVGICLGQAINKALGDKGGIARYGLCYLPMDEALVRVVIDVSNRPYLHYQVAVQEQKVGTFDTSLVKEFFRAVSQHAGITLHIDLLHGENGHHIIEAVFKGFGRALKMAVAVTGIEGALSSKGCL